MKKSMGSGIPVWRKLSTKLAIVIAVTVVLLDLILLYSNPLGPWDPMGLEYPSEEADVPLLAIDAAYTLLYALPEAAVIYCAVYWLATRRLTRLSSQVVSSFSEDGARLESFDVEGQDEVALLARALNALRSRVQDTLDRLEQRDLKRREWIAQVSHDLRTPLAALTADLDGAERACRSEMQAKAAEPILEHLAAGRRVTRRISVIATDLLDVARLEAEEPPSRERVSVRELIRRSIDAVGSLAREKGIRIESHIDADISYVEADGHLLMRALENLLSNSIQYARSLVRISASAGNAQVEFRVEDNGDGFETRDGRVGFEELRQRRSRPDSAGLGLLVVQRVAEAHGGIVETAKGREGGLAVWFTVATS